jgi:hypothetical protein
MLDAVASFLPHHRSHVLMFSCVFQAFWKGNAAAELMVVPYGAVSFLAYSSCKSWFPVVSCFKRDNTAICTSS